jgi:site-specific DNA recombinase
MLTVAYCRVSTEEQAAEGFSIAGQTERLKAYAALHELGEVTVILDPGKSGKNLDRPGLQQLLQMVNDGNVSHVLIWRLDRLSRNLGDLVELADLFGNEGIALHSFAEKIDLSSATGRMFYNILGSFAQFYREQLAENIRMGHQQAARQGRWTNHAPTGYDLVDGVLIPNSDAPTISRIYELRGEGASQAEIGRLTNTNHSTVVSILRNPAYLGLVKCGAEWLPGLHDPLVTQQQVDATHRGRTKGQRRGKDLMSGRVRCGDCGRSMSVIDNGAGWKGYRCWHRGKGCKMPSHSNKGLLKAALLPLSLLASDDELQAAIRERLDQRTPARSDGDPLIKSARERQRLDLERNRRKLLELYYADKITADLFEEEQERLTALLTELGGDEPADTQNLPPEADEFERVIDTLTNIDLETMWAAATESERRILLDEYVSHVAVYRDHLEVEVNGSPRIFVALQEVGLRSSVENTGVEDGT